MKNRPGLAHFFKKYTFCGKQNKHPLHQNWGMKQKWSVRVYSDLWVEVTDFYKQNR